MEDRLLRLHCSVAHQPRQITLHCIHLRSAVHSTPLTDTVSRRRAVGLRFGLEFRFHRIGAAAPRGRRRRGCRVRGARRRGGLHGVPLLLRQTRAPSSPGRCHLLDAGFAGAARRFQTAPLRPAAPPPVSSAGAGKVPGVLVGAPCRPLPDRASVVSLLKQCLPSMCTVPLKRDKVPCHRLGTWNPASAPSMLATTPRSPALGDTPRWGNSSWIRVRVQNLKGRRLCVWRCLRACLLTGWHGGVTAGSRRGIRGNASRTNELRHRDQRALLSTAPGGGSSFKQPSRSKRATSPALRRLEPGGGGKRPSAQPRAASRARLSGEPGRLDRTGALCAGRRIESGHTASGGAACGEESLSSASRAGRGPRFSPRPGHVGPCVARTTSSR